MDQSYQDDKVVFVCTKKKFAILIAIVGFCLTVGGIIGLIVAPIASKQQVESRIPLTENSFAATQWIDPPYIITMQFWIFNTTNADELIRGEVKPSVSQKGPYTYKQKNQKSQVVYGNNDNVSYIETNLFYFDKSRSCDDCLESDVFTVPNSVYTTVTQMFRFKDEDTKRAINLVLLALSERPFITKTVSELLLNGFEDELLTVANALSKWIPQLGEVKLPKVFQYFPKNNTNDGRYEICVGTSDVRKMGSILSWNGKKKLPWWTNDDANKVQGTDAQLFPPYLSRGDKLPIFISDLCRSAHLEYTNDIHENGLQAYRFVLPASTFDTSDPNGGFCTPTDKYFPSQSDAGTSCLPSGLLNLSSCRGSSVLISKPHFLQAAQEIIDSVDGVNPTMEHELIWDIQPTFGAAVSVKTKLQINVPLYPDPIFWSLKQVKANVIPLFWFNASAVSDEGTKQYLYQNIVIFQTAGYAATFAVFLFGLLFLLVLIACFCRRSVKTSGRWSTGERGHVNAALIEDTVAQASGSGWSQRKV